ncbi:MAG: endonuclease/exonuclease/phosphatase family protein [Pseudomonadota bacterium]
MAEHAIGRVAVWNLAGFSFDGQGIDPNSEKAKRQAEGLALLDADFVCLVEVAPLSHIDVLAAELADKYDVTYNRTILDQPDSALNIGFLHKPDVEVENVRFVPGSQGDYQGGRLAIAADIRMGKFKAIVVGVHLKSGRGKDEQNLRDTQCQAIGQWLSAVRDTSPYGHHTLVLMGDFNMIPGQDVSNFHHLGGDDVMDFVSSWDLQDRFSHILDRGRANLLDGFAVSRTYSRDYVRGSLRLFPMHWTMDTDSSHPGMGRERFKEEVSDHLPFTASFRMF